MASPLNRLGVTAFRCAVRSRPRSSFRPLPSPTSAFHISITRRDDEPPKTRPRPAMVPFDEDLESESKDQNSNHVALFDQPMEDEVIEYDGPPPTADEIAEFNEMMENPPPDKRAAIEAFKAKAAGIEAQAVAEVEDLLPEFTEPEQFARFKPGLISMGEDDEEDIGPDETFKGDDITSLAHGELEQHREIREYARIAAWEMPLLSKLAKPFELPTDQPLRFRYTSYMGETHPAEKKIVVEFCTADMPLTPRQRLKLVKLAGVRYNPQQDLVKLSCEMFPSQAQNKRYLSDVVDTLVAEARSESDAENGKDAFDDVPVDFRHVKWKNRFVFPERWKITPQRQEMLVEDRKERALKERQRVEQGLLVDGKVAVEEALRQAPALQEAAIAQARIAAGKSKPSAAVSPRSPRQKLR